MAKTVVVKKGTKVAAVTEAPTPVENNALYKRYIIILGLLAILLYANTFSHQYALDDPTVITRHSYVQEGIKGIPKILTSSYREGFSNLNDGLYRPLSVVSFAVEVALFGNSPTVGHITNVLLYALTGILLFVFLSKILNGNLLVAFIASAIFITHPVHTEAVANIKGRDEIFALLFLLLSMLFMVKESGSYFKKIISVCCFFLALLSKESSITFLVIFPLILYFFTELKLKSILVRMLPFVAIAGIYLLIRAIIVSDAMEQGGQVALINNSLVAANGISERISTAMVILLKYLGLLIFPLKLSYDYSYNEIPLHGWFDLPVLFSLLIHGALVFIAIKYFKRKSIFSFCILFYFICISIASNIVILLATTMAERLLYTPSIAFCIAAAVLISKLNFDPKRFFTFNQASIATLLLLLVFSVRTFSRNRDWKDDLTIFSHDVKIVPNSTRAHAAYGSVLLDFAQNARSPEQQKQYALQGVEEMNRAIEIFPFFAQHYTNAAFGYSMLGQHDLAIEYNLKALQQAPEDVTPHLNLCKSYLNTNQFSEAIGACGSYVKKDPASAEGFFLLARGFESSNLFDSAIVNYAYAISLNNNYKEAYLNMGITYGKKGNLDSAFMCFEKAILLDNSYADAYLNMGNVYGFKGEHAKAIEYFSKAAELSPANVQVYFNLANAYALKGDINGAIETMGRALNYDPNNVTIYKLLLDYNSATGNIAEVERLKGIIARLQGS